MIIYGNLDEYRLIEAFTNPKQEPKEALGELLKIAENYALSGNLFQVFSAWLIMHDENPFSLACEREKSDGTASNFFGSIGRYAKADILEIRAFFTEKSTIYSPLFSLLRDYTPANKDKAGVKTEIGNKAVAFAEKLARAKDEDAFFAEVIAFYQTYGVGKYGLYKAFTLDDKGQTMPVAHFSSIVFDDLWGYERQKTQLIDNTRAFLVGGQANNVLLYGDSGTGKSTGVKALLNLFFDDGLRIIQAQKNQFHTLGRVMQEIKNRNYRFILYLDDLSFEEFEVEYKYLKIAMEGGLEERPSNMLIYATSNRRHLVKETFEERGKGDIHINETIQEKVSLSDRFGLQIFYEKPLQHDYFSMVLYLAEREGFALSEEELIAKASAFGIKHGGLSGRVASQLILALKKQG